MTRKQLAGPRFRRVFRDVYVLASAALTHELRCECAALVLPVGTVITGRSAATLRGVSLALPSDPVEVVAGLETRMFRRTGVDLRRCELRADESAPWSRIGLATRRRTVFDLLLDRELPDAVADLDAALSAALVGRTEMELYVKDRHDRGIVQARRALELADPRAQSRPESRMRVHLVLDRLSPEVQFAVYHCGSWVATVDLAFPRQRLAVEYDGVWHGAPLQVGSDRGTAQPATRCGLGGRFRHAGAPARTAPDGVHRPRCPPSPPRRVNSGTSIHESVQSRGC